MKAWIHVHGKHSEEIEVENGLRQICCLSPTLFNMYMSLATNNWQERIADIDGVGIAFNYKINGKLLRRYTKNSKQCKILRMPIY